MEATKKRNIKPGTEYDHLFSKAPGENYTVRKNATLSDTVELIPKVVQQTLDQTKLITQKLKGKTIYETCKNIWHFVYGHIQYKKDETGYEQIRSPRRTWHDRRSGVDCDCYSVFISSILTNLNIPHALRITKYKSDNFQHIYPIVPLNGKHITLDCVTNLFDYEVPFSEKKDYPMELQFLDGLDDGMDELGKIIQRNMAKQKKPVPLKPKMALPIKRSKPLPVKKAVTVLTKNTMVKTASSSSPAAPAPRPSMPTPVAKPKKKGFLKKALNVVNKVNPATVLLRNGILAAMKLNVKNVAARLRWSYLSPQQAAAKNIDPVKFQKLVATRQKLEKIFYGAGGKPDNLRKAILGGKGNKDKAVNGLAMLPQEIDYLSEYTPLKQLLGQEIFYSENIEGMEGFRGFGELGEPVSLTSVGAAMGVIAGIVASLKQIGDIFKSKQKESADFDEAKTDDPENSVNVPASSSPAAIPSTATNPVLPIITTTQNTEPKDSGSSNIAKENQDVQQSESFAPPATVTRDVIPADESSESKPAVSTSSITPTNTADTADPNPGDTKENFWDKNKKWIKPVAIGVGGLTLVAIGYAVLKSKKPQNKSSKSNQSLSGIPTIKRKKQNKNHHRKSKKTTTGKKKEIALL